MLSKKVETEINQFKKMTKTQKLERALIVLLGLAFLGLSAYLGLSALPVSGSAPSGLPASPASSTQFAMTAGTVTVPIATSTTCSARVISTASTTINVQVGGNEPSATLGHFVAASTTLVLDGGIYGCGAVKIYPFSTGAATAVETQ